MGLAAGNIKHSERYDLPNLSLHQAEKAVRHMTLLGLIVVTNQLRPDSRATMSELQDE